MLSPANTYHMCCVELALKGMLVHKSALVVKGWVSKRFRVSETWVLTCYAMLMSPNKDETAVHGCHCQGDMAVRMRKVLQTAGLVFECVTCFFRVSHVLIFP